MPAVPEREHFHMDLLRAYPDQSLNCIKDYGKGPARLSPSEVNKYTTSLNSEWKRRLEFATSFTAASMRSLHQMVQGLPAGLASILPADDTASLLRTLVFVRDLLVVSNEGQVFMAACDYLDTNHEFDRDSTALEAHIVAFFSFVATSDKFVTAM